jgi:hypothetical protein
LSGLLLRQKNLDSKNMKNQEEKGRQKKTKESKMVPANSNLNIPNTGPGEEEIREKAEEIYLQRIDRGEHGTPDDDWIAAEEYLRDSQE